MQKLSVVLATYNEEKNLPACLESVKDIASEIIIVDGNSSDNTVAIAKQLGAKVHVTTNHPIFHINKQKAIDMAKEKWILQLDADERVTPELREEIKRIIANDNKEINGYWIPRKNYFLGRYLLKGGQYPDYTLRLYRNGSGRLPQKDVHEQAIVDGEVGYLNNPLIHMADKNFSRYYMRWDRYTDLIARELQKKKSIYNPIITIQYLLFLPFWWFMKTYVRHKGFMDGWQGFVFSFFSALRFPTGYIKCITKTYE